MLGAVVGCYVRGSNPSPWHSPGMKVPHTQQHRGRYVPWLQVLRIFGFTTAGAPEITCCRSKRRPIQPAPFKYDEEALKYYDFFMSECARVSVNPKQLMASCVVTLTPMCRAVWPHAALHLDRGAALLRQSLLRWQGYFVPVMRANYVSC